ncbi:RWD domain-containing protein 4-like [Symsagittifera roscoffensis]|uniref:RWD domain-containing protein 4-like n=1 Tax=Symsagittifera roscoffensis TaxID=84072 RepID=UPI00307B16C9
MSAEDLQNEEREVLDSIFDGDENFKAIDTNSFQYTVYSATSPDKTVALRIHWSSQYPEIIPNFSLELSHNNQIPPHVKANLLSELKTFAEENVGVSMTYLIVDWLKDNVDSLIPSGLKKEEVKSEQLTKRQKNKLSSFGNSQTRGRDWVDIIRHLSQMGSAVE